MGGPPIPSRASDIKPATGGTATNLGLWWWDLEVGRALETERTVGDVPRAYLGTQLQEPKG